MKIYNFTYRLTTSVKHSMLNLNIAHSVIPGNAFSASKTDRNCYFELVIALSCHQAILTEIFQVLPSQEGCPSNSKSRNKNLRSEGEAVLLSLQGCDNNKLFQLNEHIYWRIS